MAGSPERHSPDAFQDKLLSLPSGTFTGHAMTGRYLVTKTVFNDGKSIKLVAEELGGPDYISLNFYMLRSGPRLFPCEMSTAKVREFVLSLCVADGQDGA